MSVTANITDPAVASGPGEHHVVGVDFGTLSGRAVVVRVRDGAELGAAVHEYGHAVIDRTLPGDHTGLMSGSDDAVQGGR